MYGITQTLNKEQFIKEFNAARPYHFSRAALGMIYEYLDDYAWETHGNVEFDPVAICCDFEEHSIGEFCMHVDNLKHIDETDYDSFPMFIEAVNAAGIEVIDYCEEEDTVVTLSSSWI